MTSDELEEIHKSAIDAGASYDYDTYKPHITISYNAKANENILPLLFPPNFNLILSHEEVEPLKEDDVTEDIPANSTANIATFAKPLTFKIFKRKLAFSK